MFISLVTIGARAKTNGVDYFCILLHKFRFRPKEEKIYLFLLFYYYILFPDYKKKKKKQANSKARTSTFRFNLQSSTKFLVIGQYCDKRCK